MRKADVRIGDVFTAKVSNQIVNVRIDAFCYGRNGWEATNLSTGRRIRIKSAARLRERINK